MAALVCTWNYPILEAHSFRQTQTALTSFWLARGGPFFAYETPVLGAPWSVPFELPIYQAIVAGVHIGLRIPLDAAGRVMCWLGFACAVWQLHAIVRKLGGSRSLGLLLCGLVLCSPHYVFWSRTFMIESTALAFSLAFVSVALSHIHSPRAWRASALIGFACLAALVKVTTFVPLGGAAAIIAAWDLRQRARSLDVRHWLWHYMPIAVAGLIAMVVVAVWNAYCDDLKQMQPFGRNLTSTLLRPWLYGSWAQRSSLILWRDVVFGRAVDEALGGRLPLLCAFGAALAFGRSAVAWFSTLLGLYILPFLVFTNLHIVHDYYQYANALFAICAVGIVVWHAGTGRRRWIAYAVLATTITFQAVRLARIEWPTMTASQSSSDTLSLRRKLQHLPDEGVVLVLGYDWSSEVAYYLKHRTITVPFWASRAQLESLRDRPAEHTGGRPVVAVIECPHPFRGSPELGPIVNTIFNELTRGKQQAQVKACTVWR